MAADLGASDDDARATASAAHESLSGGGIFGVVVGVLFIAAMFVGGIYVIFAKKGTFFTFPPFALVSQLSSSTNVFSNSLRTVGFLPLVLTTLFTLFYSLHTLLRVHPHTIAPLCRFT